MATFFSLFYPESEKNVGYWEIFKKILYDFKGQ